MSETSTAPRSGGPRIEVLVIAAVVVVAALAVWYVMSQRQQTLRSSPSGLDGLQVWLTSNDITSYNFSGGWPIDQTTVDLLILPVYDTALDVARTPPASKEEYLLQSDKVIASKDWQTQKIVIIKFDSKEQLDQCFQSAKYREIIPLREGSIVSRFIMVES